MITTTPWCHIVHTSPDVVLIIEFRKSRKIVLLVRILLFFIRYLNSVYGRIIQHYGRSFQIYFFMISSNVKENAPSGLNDLHYSQCDVSCNFSPWVLLHKWHFLRLEILTVEHTSVMKFVIIRFFDSQWLITAKVSTVIAGSNLVKVYGNETVM